MKITFRDHQGKGRRLAAALVAAGHELVDDGDVLFIDTDIPLSPNLRLLDRFERVMLYPHGGGVPPMAWPTSEVACRFEIGAGQAAVLERHGYTGRVETVGWPFSDRLPWRPAEPRRVLLAPEHPAGCGWMPDGMREANARVHDALAVLPVELCVRHVVADVEALGITTVDGVEYRRGKLDVDDAAAAIAGADVVVAAAGTFPSLALALGCPTVMYFQGNLDDWDSDRQVVMTAPFVDEQDLFPLDADWGELWDVLRAASDESLIADWRARFVGDVFDPDVFVGTFEKVVASW